MELRAGMLVYHRGSDPREAPVYKLLPQEFGVVSLLRKPYSHLRVSAVLSYKGLTRAYPLGRHHEMNREKMVEFPEVFLLARIANGEDYCL